MILPDVNVLIYAHRREAAEHRAYVKWLQELATSPEPFALSELVCSAFLRTATNPRAFDTPTELAEAVDFIARLRDRPTCVVVRPGLQHWEIFVELCAAAKARGKLIADAYHAALALEHGCEWVSADGDFARFPRLRWRHPLRQS